MVLFSGTPEATGVPAPSPRHKAPVGDGYVVVNIGYGAEVRDDGAKLGIPSEGMLMLGSDGNENEVVVIDMKPKEGTEMVVSSQVEDIHTEEVET